MAKKVYVKGNYLYIEDTVTGVKISGNAGSFEFVLIGNSTEDYLVKKDTFLILSELSISQMQEENGTPYTISTFEAFKESSTGFSSASGSSGAVPVLGSEFLTGSKMLGGKPIYEKYIDLTGLVNSAVILTGVDQLTFYAGVGNTSLGAFKQLPYGYSTDWIELKITGASVELFTNQTAQLSGAYARVQYTKA